ncbi:hypothetical protein CA267_002510 [Alteromonas pelagimontana]|uniref:Lipoprotein n=1 Tax=Alteromonas pelagimontana TaxID=1858656 RepID=A0A6M4MB04_9ALTE|nr:hypothetical protein [Alteromonas pelagimontana]QJR79745.1 hypothetical protein CA267_002510 [Alteromonas pelagimontana]
MKNPRLLGILILSLTTFSCSVLPLSSEIEKDHFRFENFKRDKGPTIELVHLMCFHQQPTGWTEPKQFQSGPQNLWVKANISQRGIPNSTKEAYANFKVDLDPGKSYMLNRTVEGDQISIWIQEVDSGLQVSKVSKSQLKQPLLVDNYLRRQQCEQGSV